MCTGET